MNGLVEMREWMMMKGFGGVIRVGREMVEVNLLESLLIGMEIVK